MEALSPELMELDCDLDETLEAFRDLAINGRCPQQRQFKRQVEVLKNSRSRQRALVT
jgi:hypothetical protein